MALGTGRLAAAALVAAFIATGAVGQGGGPGSAMLFAAEPAGAGALLPAALPLVGSVSGAGPVAGGGRALPLDGAGAAPLGTPMSSRRRERGRSGPGQRCTADGLHCIALDSYVADVCRTIEDTAREAGLDAHFFARLIWQESRFNANAVSHAGAQGIAQFMPGTARMRGLADPFNPAEALRASAALLTDLRDQFGNLGLAAAAYNAGPGRVDRFVARRSGLPGETRAYVATITGHPATAWRQGRPTTDFRLDRSVPFQQACVAMAGGRGLRAFATPPQAADARAGDRSATRRASHPMREALGAEGAQRGLPDTVLAAGGAPAAGGEAGDRAAACAGARGAGLSCGLARP